MGSTNDNVIPSKLPPGLRLVGPDAFLIQIQRKGVPLTRRVHGKLKEALRELERAKVELGERIAALATAVPMATTSTTAVAAPALSSPTLEDWLVGRFKDHQERHQSERTRRKLESPIRYLLASDLAQMPLHAIGTAEINGYISWRMKVGTITFAERKDGKPYKPRALKVGAVTINKSLRVLSTALNLARRERTITEVPTIEFLAETDARGRWAPTREEYNLVVQAAERLRDEAPWLPELIELLAEFGLRPSEALTLPWSSVQWRHRDSGDGRGGMWVEEQGHVFMPKNGKRRFIPFTVRGREVLQKLYARTPPPKDSDLVIPNTHGLPYIRRDVPGLKGGGAGVWKKLKELTGLRELSMYSLRHYFAREHLAAGVPLHGVSKWMGHSKVELTAKRYGEFSADNADQHEWAQRRAQVPRAG